MTNELFNDSENLEMETEALHPITFEDYVQARRDKTPLRVEIPGAVLTLDCGYSMDLIYRNLQAVFIELLCHDIKNFIEN
jgi:hypothetical protein